MQKITYRCNTVVVGSGAAGFNAADRLYSEGQTDILIVTEHILAGTSRNTGSDKQTYYKLTLSGGGDDSVREMAETLFSGECVDGDIALCEAALSTQCFFKLCELGVPFPRNRYGEYIGYKTDHDPRCRATSIGPYTSKKMTEVLEASVRAKNITILDKLQAIQVLAKDGEVLGLLCLNLDCNENEPCFVLIACKNIVFATGGPAGIYANSVYPNGHYGASGIAFEAGVSGKNLTEWQYGLASIKPRWNVSGTYMQVLPRFISTDKDGENPREFLFDFFTKKNELLEKVFLKGYQWPFDVRKITDGSSIIDILVYLEQRKGRRTFLDFRDNPNQEPIDFSQLPNEVRDYLEKAQATFGTPIERLLQMNTPAVDFYQDRGIDLRKEPIEIALCAQHNNGGLSIDCWWQTNVTGFFAVGEVAASHGVYRPGGSALNAGQVGSTRAAQFIAAKRQGNISENVVFDLETQVEESINFAKTLFTNTTSNSSLNDVWSYFTTQMNNHGGAIRSEIAIQKLLGEIEETLCHFTNRISVTNTKELAKAYRLKDILISQKMYLTAMLDYLKVGGKSRGSALYSDPSDIFTFLLDQGDFEKNIQEVQLIGNETQVTWRVIRPIPTEDDFFENVWKSYRENKNIE